MPKLPTRDDLGALPSARPTGATAIARYTTSIPDTRVNSQPIAKGMADFGKGVTAIGIAAEEIAEEKRKIRDHDTETRFQEFKWSQEKDLEQSKLDVGPERIGSYADDWAEHYKPQADSFLDSVDEDLKEKYDKKLFDTERNLYGNAAKFAYGKQKDFSKRSIDDLSERVWNERAALSRPEDWPKLALDIAGHINKNPFLDKFEKQDLIREKVRSAFVSGVEAMDPEERITFLESQSPDIKIDGEDQKPSAEDILRKFEGFRAKAYWDKNAWRAGYGSDTVTRADGSVESVTPSTIISQEDAERDLVRRTEESAVTAAGQVGEEVWASLDDNVRAALVSVSYNYGSLPKSVVKAVASGDVQAIAKSVASLSANKTRRLQEAAVIRGSSLSKAETYAILSHDDREDLLDKARKELKTKKASQEWFYKDSFKGELKHIEETGDFQLNDDFLESSRSWVEPSVFEKHMRDRKEAKLVYDAVSDMREQSSADLEDRVNSLKPTGNEQAAVYLTKWNVWNKANKEKNRIIKLRTSDPAAAADELPEVEEVKGTFDKSNPVESWQKLISLRLAAQDRFGIVEAAREPITKADAEVLAAQIKDLSGDALEKGMKILINQIDDTYGVYSREVFRSVLKQLTRKKDLPELAEYFIEQLIKGNEIDEQEWRQFNDLEELNIVNRAINPQESEGETEQPAEARERQQQREPEVKEIDVDKLNESGAASKLKGLVRSRPDIIEIFDRKYGKGAALKVLEADPSGKYKDIIERMKASGEKPKT